MKTVVELREIDSSAKYWLVRAEGGKYYDNFKYERFISVHHNEITLEMLSFTELLLTEEKTLEKFKEIVSRIHKDDNWSKQKIASIAKRLYYFVEGMSVGDYVVVPSHKSNYFLIGEIISDPFEESAENISSLKSSYETVDHLKRRRVNWINEVPRYKMNSKFLYRTLTMHQAIIDVTQHSEYIDGLISPLYAKNGNLFLRLNVNTDRPITSDMWYSLYSIINSSQNSEKNERIVVKANVESPGFIVLSSSLAPFLDYIGQYPIQSGILTLALLFGDIDIGSIKLKGIVPSIQVMNQQRHQNKKARLENELTELELETQRKQEPLTDLDIQIELEKKQQELQELQQSRRNQINVQRFDITVDAPNVNYGDGQQMQMDYDLKEDEE